MSNDASRLTTIAIGWLAITCPLLAFPELFWPWGRWGVAAVGVASLLFAIRLAVGMRPVNYFVAILALTGIVAWFRVADRENALSHFCGMAVGLLSMVTVARWCRTPRQLGMGGALFLVLGLFALAIGLSTTSVRTFDLIPFQLTDRLPFVELNLPGLEPGGRVNANALSGLAVMIMPVAVAFLRLPRPVFQGEPGVRLIAVLTCACVAVIVVIAQSRSAWLAAVLTTCVAVVRLSGRWRWRVVAPLIVLTVSTGLLVVLGGQDVIRQEGMGPWQESFQSRAIIWRDGLDQFRAAPWLGIGLNEFRHVLDMPRGRDEANVAHAHNIFLQTGLDLGLLGLLAYVALFAYLIVRADQAARGPDVLVRRVGGGAGLALIGVHLFGMSDAISLGAKVGLFQWLASGLILAAWRSQFASPNSLAAIEYPPEPASNATQYRFQSGY